MSITSLDSAISKMSSLLNDVFLKNDAWVVQRNSRKIDVIKFGSRATVDFPFDSSDSADSICFYLDGIGVEYEITSTNGDYRIKSKRMVMQKDIEKMSMNYSFFLEDKTREESDSIF